MQGALDDFTRLVVYASPDGPGLEPTPATSDWYRDRCAEMRQGIERLVQTGSLSAPPPFVPPPGPTKRTPFKWPISTLYAGNLSSLPVVGRIPAGGFGPTGIDAQTNEKLSLQPTWVVPGVGRARAKAAKDKRPWPLRTADKTRMNADVKTTKFFRMGLVNAEKRESIN